MQFYANIWYLVKAKPRMEEMAEINHILKGLQKQANLNQIGGLSGHSFRVGSALDLLDKNISLEKIILRGGWKSETSAMRYLQSWSNQNWAAV